MANNCNCGETCVGGLTCHCNDSTTFICPGGNCSIPNNGNCGCSCCPPEQLLPETHRVQRLIAPSRDTHTNWNDKDPVILEGVLGYTKDRLFNGSLEYFIGDGVHKYSELTKYAAAEASASKKANTLVLRNGNGKIDKASLPDDLVDIPEATSTTLGLVKASTTTAANNVVKADGNGSLADWKDALSAALVNESGGLNVDSSGNLAVDFSQMPTDKFEDLLKSLKMQIPLEANLSLYVDTSHAQAADTLVDGRGTQAKPFKTIQACVDFATQTYALGRYNINIYVANGTYTENVTLPEYTHTSGVIDVRALDFDNPPTVKNATIAGHVVSATGGTWRLYRLNLVGEFDTDENITTAVFPKTLESVGAGTLVALFGCSVSAEYTGDVPAHNVQIRTLLADDGTINISTIAGYKNSFSCTKGNATTAYMLHGLRGGDFRLIRNLAADDGIRYDIPCSGSMDTFCYLSQSSFSGAGSGNQPQFSGTITGKAYEVYNGSTVNLPTSGFPGDTSTSIVESTTYSWVKN